jgi:hypothetical protein
MGYGIAKRMRRRPAIDPMTGYTVASQRRLVGEEEESAMYFAGPDEEHPWCFDLESWAEENDPTCHPAVGGVANPTSLAARTRLSIWTLVNSVLPMCDVHWVGPIAITNVKSFDADYRDYRSFDGRRSK